MDIEGFPIMLKSFMCFIAFICLQDGLWSSLSSVLFFEGEKLGAG